MTTSRLMAQASTVWLFMLWPHIVARADDQQDKIAALEARVAQLEAREQQNWMTQERADQIRAIVQEVLADAKKQQADAPNVGYDNGFFIQTADKNFKLTIGGVLQARYEFAMHHADNSSFAVKPLAQGENENSSGFDIRRAPH